MKRFGLVALWTLLWHQVTSYSVSPRAVGRRDVFRIVLGTITSGYIHAPRRNANAVVSSKYCASGVGEGCQDLAEGNEFILSLQEKSAANKDQNEKAARDAYYMKNYPDWFATVGKTLVKKADGSFVALSNDEFTELKKANKIALEIPKAMGGQVTDVTQKPILLLKE